MVTGKLIFFNVYYFCSIFMEAVQVTTVKTLYASRPTDDDNA